ncbi:MAG: helix-turn-helix domain-containing protein [Clostridia bacterium]|nr:helix-turn-helix domain-containing protein [Clostridia bacterium]
MIINYDVKKITAVLRDFRIATGIEAQLLKPDFTYACEYRTPDLEYCKAFLCTEKGKTACRMSDEHLLKKCRASRKTEMSICHAGLLNVVIPLLLDDVIIGYIIFGGMKTSGDFLNSDTATSSCGEEEVMSKCYDAIPTYGIEKIQSISNVAIMLAKYILLKNMLRPSVPESIQAAVDYINTELEGELSVTSICKNSNISKSALYKRFHEHFGCTVSEYIKARRVERAKELITVSELSMEEIAQRVGFSGASYFSRVFKEHTGMAPMKYKKSGNT